MLIFLLVQQRPVQGAPTKNEGSTDLSQTLRLCEYYYSHNISCWFYRKNWFNRYSNLNFNVQFFKWTCSYAFLNVHWKQISFLPMVQTFQWWVSAPYSSLSIWTVFRMSPPAMLISLGVYLIAFQHYIP